LFIWGNPCLKRSIIEQYSKSNIISFVGELELINDNYKNNNGLRMPIKNLTLYITIIKRIYSEFEKLHFNSSVIFNENNDSNKEISSVFKNLNIGNLFSLSCGHNGGYSEHEQHVLIDHLIRAEFIREGMV
jgi:hypothetical protein